jgi:DNA ligase-1
MPTRFTDLVGTSAAVREASGRLDKVARLADLLRRLADDEIAPAVAFLSGQTTQGRLGVGYASVAAAADVPAASEATLSIAEIDRAFEAMAAVSGPGSAHERARQLRAIFSRTTAPEQDFLRRLLYGELRQGALESAIVEAIARAATIPVAAIRRAVMMAGDIGPVARAALLGDTRAVDAFAVQVMRPVRPMLADSEDSVSAALSSLGDASLEYKLDGARIQVHKAGDDVRVFSRTLNDVTAAVPEIVLAARALPVRDAIVDGEAIALSPDGRPLPFQVTMRRFGRTRNVDAARAELPLTPFLFDCLYADGRVVVDEPLEQRAQMLQEIAAGLTVPRIVRPTPEEAETFARDALARGHEGVMAKALGAPYSAGRRGSAWLKIKQARTLDLVVLAAEWGHGRRRGWLSNLHLGARDPEAGTFVMLGKTFKGLTDQMLTWQTEKLLALETGRDAATVYVRPELVAEIAFNEIQQSPVYPGGLALRFARVVRYREDKTAAEADTIATVRLMR